MELLPHVVSRLRQYLGASADGASERQDQDATSPWWGEHLARYRFALGRLPTGARLLDVACGTGYGLRMLADHGAQAFGMDVDPQATRLARVTVGDRSALVLRGDGCQLPFADATFSTITSFETLEHLPNRGSFVAELRRVLAPGGLLILSTPNAHHTRPVNGVPRNRFHLFEYTPEQLQGELGAHFDRVELIGQVLDGRFRIPPFWDEQQRLPRTAGVQARLWARKAMNRLPVQPRERLSRALWGHGFYPSEDDYHFDVVGVERAPTLVALCRP